VCQLNIRFFEYVDCKKRRPDGRLMSREKKELFAQNSPNWASINTGFTIGTEILINDMKITAFTNGFNRATVGAGCTIGAVLRNVMASHGLPPL
jgi:hypothetical protein